MSSTVDRYAPRRPRVYYAHNNIVGDGMNWVVPGKLIAGHYLGSPIKSPKNAKLEILKEHRVNTIIDLTHPSDELRSYAVPDGMRRLKFPIKDETCDNDDMVLKGAKETVRSLRNRGAVYVHCWGGHGRTGVVVAVTAALYLGISSEMALYLTSLSHSTRKYIGSNGVSNSPQSQGQEEQVHRVVAASLLIKPSF
jgi:protein tyrosine/serine phosphatase